MHGNVMTDDIHRLTCETHFRTTCRLRLIFGPTRAVVRFLFSVGTICSRLVIPVVMIYYVTINVTSLVDASKFNFFVLQVHRNGNNYFAQDFDLFVLFMIFHCFTH